MKNLILFFAHFILPFVLFAGCQSEFPIKDKLDDISENLLNQDSMQVQFPDKFNKKILLIGFIYTNCPDICPMTTHNMHLVEEQLNNEGIKDFKLVALSFDPNRDKPFVLKKYAEIRSLDLNRWTFLTGDEPSVKNILKRFEVTAVPSDSSYSPTTGELRYYIIHSDKIALIDDNGFLRKVYPGSTAKVEEIVEDIKKLRD
jgi:protein SCO1/2